MITSIEKFRLFVESAGIDTISISCAALASIVIDDKYLLIKEDKKFQPIGGGLKYYDFALPFLESIGFTTGRDDNDIRINIRADAYNAFKMWFNSGIDRETTIDREFEEEISPYIDYSLLTDMSTDEFKTIEIVSDKYRIFQIHNITFNDSIKKIFLDAIDATENLALFTRDEVINKRDIIAGHCRYILQ